MIDILFAAVAYIMAGSLCAINFYCNGPFCDLRTGTAKRLELVSEAWTFGLILIMLTAILIGLGTHALCFGLN